MYVMFKNNYEKKNSTLLYNKDKHSTAAIGKRSDLSLALLLTSLFTEKHQLVA